MRNLDECGGGTEAMLRAGLYSGSAEGRELALCSHGRDECGGADRLGSLLSGEMALITDGRRHKSRVE